MLTGLKELKNRVAEMWQPWQSSGTEDYWKIEYSAERHLRNPELRERLTYEEESRIRTVKFH